MSKSRHTKPSRQMRRLALAAMLISATGCASGQPSLTSPFAKKTADPAAPPSGGLTSSVSGLVQGTRNQASTMSMAVKSAYSKGRDSVVGAFGGTATTTQADSGEKMAANDPLLLQNRPASIGPEVFIANGQLWESTGSFERAMENYSKALEKHPENAAALASVARLNVRQERYEPAVDYFQRAIKADPAEAALYHDLGLALSKLGRHEEAIVAIGKSLAVAPGTSRYANSLATTLFAAGREDEAKAQLLKSNKPAVAHYNMAYLYYSSQRTDQALQELRQVLAMGPPTDGDSGSQRAWQRSQELFSKLGGPATQIAQALPGISAAAEQSAAAISELSQDAGGIAAQVRDTASGVSVQLSSGVPATPGKTLVAETAPPADQNTAPPYAVTQNSATQNAAAPAAQPPSGSMFQLPPELLAPSGVQPEARTAERPSETPPQTQTR